MSDNCTWCGAGPNDLHPAACPSRSRGESARYKGRSGDWCVTFDDGSVTLGTGMVGYNSFVGRRYGSVVDFAIALSEVGLRITSLDPDSAVGQMVIGMDLGRDDDERSVVMESDCEICSHDASDVCLADHPVTSLRCTRRKDHDGSHVTCGFSAHAVESWYDDERSEP